MNSTHAYKCTTMQGWFMFVTCHAKIKCQFRLNGVNLTGRKWMGWDYAVAYSLPLTLAHGGGLV